MKISAKGRYALRVMLYIAMHGGQNRVSVRDISEALNISSKYLEQILTMLCKAGFVHGVRGPRGGYSLVRNPEEYTVGSILRQMEGDLAPIEGINDFTGDKKQNPEKEDGVMWVYMEMNNALNSVVDKISLADMIEHKLVQVGNYSI